MKKITMAMLLLSLLICTAGGCTAVWAGESGGDQQTVQEKEEKIRIKVLLLPKFEIEEMAGDFPGEAQYYYENYLKDGETYELSGHASDEVLYVKDGIALYMLGMGKVSAALGTMEVLSDERFDFSDAYIISTGCAGSAAGYTVMGDVIISTAAVDYDLGHHADIRDMQEGAEEPEEGEDPAATWFHDPDYDEAAVIRLDPDLMEKVYSLVRDVPLETTEKTREYMRAAFDGAAWAVRDPEVRRGTTVTGDNYWKGIYGHQNALLMMETYGCPDPFAVTEMEDVAIGAALRRMGLLDHYIIIRDSVNMDVFMNGATPESLWDPDFEEQKEYVPGGGVEKADIFKTAMKNNYAVGSVLIDAILSGELDAD